MDPRSLGRPAGAGIPGRSAILDVRDKATTLQTLLERTGQDSTAFPMEVRRWGELTLVWGLTQPLATGASVTLDLTENTETGGKSLFRFRPLMVQVTPDTAAAPDAGGLTGSAGPTHPEQSYDIGSADFTTYGYRLVWEKRRPHWQLVVSNLTLTLRDFAFSIAGV